MRLVAFPRGINVGGRVVPMARLRELLEHEGFTSVHTVLASGNVAFDADHVRTADDVTAVRRTIERLMSAEFDYDAVVQVYPAEALERCLEAAPWGPTDRDTHHYLVLVDDDDVRTLLLSGEFDTSVEAVEPAKLGVYWRVPQGQTTGSDFAAVIAAGRVKRHVTTRKLDTLRKLLA